ncbi:response regulator transcription factor [Crocinitomix catalasitica]|uniref:response regulator transcription factor n=1 Tax=Crocinitomix catalasitica TaxID=184607 RepID=UPI0004814BFF|nr:response regulator transcription factor [Crocinitomix catalasitica]
MIRIAIIDTCRFFRVSFTSFLSYDPEFIVETDVSTINEIPINFNYQSIDLVIYDPSSSRKADFQEIQKKFSNAKVIILSFDASRKNVMEFMHEGISGYYSKDDCPNQLNKTIIELAKSVNYEEIRLGAVVRQKLIADRGSILKRKINLSRREIEVLKLVCLEKTNAEISSLLNLSIRTIESHRRRMIEKADCRSIIGVILSVLDVDSESLPINLQQVSQVS